MTLDDFINGGNEWPKDSLGFRAGWRGRVVWQTAHYPDGSDGNKVLVSRIVREGGRTFTRVAYYDRDTRMIFVCREVSS